MALTFPNIDPVAVAIGPLQIRWYALAYLAGILLGWAYAVYFAKKDEAKGARPNRLDIDDFIPFAVMGVILGGRIGYVLFYQPGYYFSNPSQILQLWHGGMSFHGGALGVIIALIAYSIIRKIPMFRLGDLMALCCTIGLFFGRIANFINGELFGRVTEAPVGMVFPNGGPEPRHPSQLYEAALEGILLFAILSLLYHREWVRERPGIVGGAFLIGYGACRMFVENFREPDAYLGFLSLGLTMGQWLCVPMILVGASFIVMALKRPPYIPAKHVHAAA
ncbi:MAG: prolipoprotein diacylglyceryl transferase [Micavibrio aeruginosavorus]|uniref:Phosphatidylglycerol--prolipoprotein diacylglyceryl transferase n=1 Tax=Micavibrio aeruginosavorus TaxID=349221 RepID=A0A2W5MRL9_9BACT|nr:MAG: prolipoprotein diacylglyceryl transferase [Micavibrio aeruginosavorus]